MNKTFIENQKVITGGLMAAISGKEYCAGCKEWIEKKDFVKEANLCTAHYLEVLESDSYKYGEPQTESYLNAH